MAFLLLAAIPARVLAASPPPSIAYGEVARFGGFDATATYETTPASTQIPSLTPGKLVDPVGMALDVNDPSAPDGYAIYVLDNLNPQELENAFGAASFTTLVLQYRLQKLDEHGNVLGSTTFSLTSSAQEPGLHAVSLAVDSQDGRVYALIMDTPPTLDNEVTGANAVERIDAWGTVADSGALTAVAGLAADPQTGAGELAGPDAAHQLQGASLAGDIDGESIAVDGTGTDADLALAGNVYGGGPIIERIFTTGAQAGTVDGSPWEDTAATEDPAAQAWRQSSHRLDSLSADPNGGLNVTLGEHNGFAMKADQEPNMAQVSADLSATTSILPWADAIESAEAEEANRDRAATVGFVQDTGGRGYQGLEHNGATEVAGTLAPSVVPLAGNGQQFPSGAYAGLVVDEPAQDPQRPLEAPFTWALSAGESSPANLGIRVFDAQGDSLGMIGNQTAGGPCNLQGGPSGSFHGYGSFVALAPGRDGVLFALVQSDLAGTPGTIEPATASGRGMGDQIVEFAPGAGQSGAAGQACPQPSGGFSITNETQAGSTPSTGSGPVTVPSGTTLKFDASEIDLLGGSPWAYDWDFENGEPSGVSENQWTPALWKWPAASTQFTYNTPGSFTAKLNLLSDFGALPVERTVNVVQPGPITAGFTAGAGATMGRPVAFDASNSTFPQFDSIVDYHWEFGDGQGDDQPNPSEQHSYQAVGQYTVKLKITDALGQTAHVEHTISVVAPPHETTGGGGTGGGSGGGSAGGGGTVSSGGTATAGGGSTPAQTADISPTNVNARIASAASAQGTVAVSVSCPAGKPSCSGTVLLKTAPSAKGASAAKSKQSAKHGAAAPVSLGQAKFSLAGGHSETVKLKLSSKGIALLRSKHTLKVIATVTASDPGGHVKVTTLRITLHAPPAAKRPRGKAKH